MYTVGGIQILDCYVNKIVLTSLDCFAHTQFLSVKYTRLALRQVTWLDWPFEYGTFKKSWISGYCVSSIRCITMFDHAKTQELFLFNFSKSPQLFSSALFRSNSVNRSSWLYFWSVGERERGSKTVHHCQVLSSTVLCHFPEMMML